MTDDLNAKISEVLSDPESMKQLTELATMLGAQPGVHNEEPSPKPPMPDLSALGSPGSLGGSDLGMLSRLMPMLSSVSRQDDTTRLLSAIRPFLSEERKLKLDEANKLLRMMKLLPLLKDFKLFDS